MYKEIDPRVIKNYLIENGQLEYAEHFSNLVDNLYELDKKLQAVKSESPSPEGWVSVEIEFGSHLRCMLSFSGDELKIDGAVNGWGNPVTADEIKITKLPKPPKQ